MNNGDTITLTTESVLRARGILFSLPRELNGNILSAIEETLSFFEGDDSASFIDRWYRNADTVSYDNTEAAAAYLGAYGPRSILKYQEALFALLIAKGFIHKYLRIIDFGAGPCIGFGALIDLLSVLAESANTSLELDYVAVDRSEHMLEVGDHLCHQLIDNTRIQVNYKLFRSSDFTPCSANILFIANVMNDGEGNLDCSQFITSLVEPFKELEDIVVIEPATEQPSRQLCGLDNNIDSWQYIGPCIPGEVACSEWTFRQFSKRIYACERRCLGKWASAAQIGKYSLALLSSISNPRILSEGESVIIRKPSASGWAQTCFHGQKQMKRVTPQATPWDIIDRSGKLVRRWP